MKKDGDTRWKKQEIQQRRDGASPPDNSEEQFRDESCVPSAEVTSSAWSRSKCSRREFLKKMKLIEYLMSLNILRGGLDRQRVWDCIPVKYTKHQANENKEQKHRIIINGKTKFCRRKEIIYCMAELPTVPYKPLCICQSKINVTVLGEREDRKEMQMCWGQRDKRELIPHFHSRKPTNPPKTEKSICSKYKHVI